MARSQKRAADRRNIDPRPTKVAKLDDDSQLDTLIDELDVMLRRVREAAKTNPDLELRATVLQGQIEDFRKEREWAPNRILEHFQEPFVRPESVTGNGARIPSFRLSQMSLQISSGLWRQTCWRILVSGYYPRSKPIFPNTALPRPPLSMLSSQNGPNGNVGTQQQFYVFAQLIGDPCPSP
jgi:hypothetical protein